MALATSKSQTSQPAAPAVVTVYRALDGGIHHTRCNQLMVFRGASGPGIELEFHCTSCHEHVTLPYFVAARLPITTSEA